MTPEQAVKVLEELKDLTNEHGKLELCRVIGSIKEWLTIKPEGLPPTPPDRRAEERDPGEVEQHLAEDLGLAPKKKRG